MGSFARGVRQSLTGISDRHMPHAFPSEKAEERCLRRVSRLALVTDRPWTLNLTNRGPVECASVTAETSPHHRPIDWEFLGRMTGTPAAQKLVKAQQKLIDEDLQWPLRIRGHLFFDASHGLSKGNADPGGKSIPSTALRSLSSKRSRHAGLIERFCGRRWWTGC